MIRFLTYNILDGGIGRENHLLEILMKVGPEFKL
jgi:hypothetical protein